MSHLLDRLGKTAADFLFPQFCLGCGREGAVLCSSCLSRLPKLSAPFCPRCGLPQTDNNPCRDCYGLELAIDGIRSPLVFQRLSREAVHQLKYQNIRALAAPLATVLHAYLTENPLPTNCLVPVPLHPHRLRERGYNQSLLLAHELAKLTGLPLISSTLKRQTNTPPQARTASAAERHGNMRGAFMLADGKLAGKQVLLIDDVSTSGATLDACAAALKQGGAATVWGLSVAREI